MAASRTLVAHAAHHSGVLHGPWGNAGAVAVGLLFMFLGLEMALGLRALAHRWVELPGHGAKWLHDANLRLSGGKMQHYQRCKSEGMREILGWGFVGMGTPAFLAGLVGLVVLV
jgi:hypothetical protein